jgi:adenosylmethionine-8-amino-7-oxononanoate aminotransferase
MSKAGHVVGQQDLAQIGKRHQWLPLGRDESYFDVDPIIVTRGEGAYFYDSNGRRFLDALCCQSAGVLGHNHPRVVDAMREQLSKMVSNVAGVLPSDRSIELASRLSELARGELTRTFFCTTGSDGNDTAIKLARQYWKNAGRGGKFKTIVRRHGYHGGTLATNAASGNFRYPHSAFEPLPTGFVHISSPYPYRCVFCRSEPRCTLECAEELRRSLEYEDPETVACFLAETTMAVGGLIPPPPGYLRRVREICDEHEILMMLDEVVTGMGRTGDWFEYQVEGVIPDVVVLAKVLTNGHMPLGALLVREEIAAAFQGRPRDRFVAGSTLAGTPLACAAALATIETIDEDDLIARGVNMSRAATERLLALQANSPIVGEVRVKGVLMGIEWVADRETRRSFASPPAVKQRAVEIGHEHGVHFFGGPESVLLWIPPLTIDDAALDHLLSTVEAVVAVIEREFEE